jgi:hypothetical protein
MSISLVMQKRLQDFVSTNFGTPPETQHLWAIGKYLGTGY